MIKRPEHDEAERRGAFASMVAHELRTPLTAAFGALEMMARSGESSPAADARNAVLIDLAHRNTQRLLRIVEDCLDLEAASDGRLTLARESVEAGDLVTTAVAASFSARDQTGIQVVAQLDAAHRVAGDRQRLARALGHLVQNAVTFAPPGTAVTVTTADVPERGTVRFTVEDLGAGIEPDKFRVLFQEFDCRDAAGRNRVGGLGMGLAFVRMIACEHGGSVGVRSEPGRTAVWFEIPAAAA